MREAWDRTEFERKKENKRRAKNGKSINSDQPPLP